MHVIEVRLCDGHDLEGPRQSSLAKFFNVGISKGFGNRPNKGVLMGDARIVSFQFIHHRFAIFIGSMCSFHSDCFIEIGNEPFLVFIGEFLLAEKYRLDSTGRHVNVNAVETKRSLKLPYDHRREALIMHNIIS